MLTASSTRAAISRGVDTATSTPQASSNIHSFLGLLTLATTRGTPNSVLASSETTRLTLSSPVAATTTSQLARPASSSASISQASACSRLAVRHLLHRAPGRRSRSTSSTWCSLRSSSRAMDRPRRAGSGDDDAHGWPSGSVGEGVRRRGRAPRWRGPRAAAQVEQVAVLVHGVRARKQTVAEAGEVRDPAARGGLDARRPGGRSTP